MKTLMAFVRSTISTVLLTLALTGCGPRTAPPEPSSEESSAPLRAATPDSLSLALAPHEGDNPTDKEIRRFQEQVRNKPNRTAALERLGWAFVAKARGSFDTGFYKLAQACADILDCDSPGCPEALLLRGHVFQNLHRFKEAESLARELVAKRGLSFDCGLLGDTLMEQGRIKEAVAAYQTMVDMRPDLQSYSRIAHVRWLTGDLEGAIEMLRAAVSAGSPSDADSAAWVNSRLAALEFQAGNKDLANRACEAALESRPDYPPALLLRGKMLLGRENPDTAIADLERAAQQNPLPEYQWTLAEALRGAGRDEEAEQVETRLRSQGAMNDPRTYSLYLATRGEEPGLAVRLAEQELQQREDVFTHDALGWALAAAGRIEEARTQMDRALAEHTQDARLFFHAAVIAVRSGRTEDATNWFTSAAAMMNLLLPSEQEALLKLSGSLARSDDETKTHLPPSAVIDLSTSAIAAEGK